MVRQSILRFLKLTFYTSILFINCSFAVAQKTETPQLDMTVNRGVIKPISLAVFIILEAISPLLATRRDLKVLISLIPNSHTNKAFFSLKMLIDPPWPPHRACIRQIYWLQTLRGLLNSNLVRN